MDAFGHVNNTTYFRSFEPVRIGYFAQIGWAADPSSGRVGPILAQSPWSCCAPLVVPDAVVLAGDGIPQSPVGDFVPIPGEIRVK